MKRSKWKSLYVNPNILNNQVKNIVLKVSRNSAVLPKFVGLIVQIHSGRSFKQITVNKNMVGYKFGEFAQTRAIFSFKKKKKKK